MASIYLRVTPEQLKTKASAISGEVSAIRKQWTQLQRTVQNSKSYWQGDASDAHQKYLKEVSGDVELMIKRLEEHPTDLLKMAGVYTEAESTAKQLSNSLPNDVLG